MAKKRKFKKETESFLIAPQNNAIRTNHIKVKIDKTQQNSTLCGDRDETINDILSECNKLAQKEYKTRYNWLGKVIHSEICKKFKFDHTNKWYMHNPAPVLKNNTYKLLWNYGHTHRSPNLGQMTRPNNNQHKRESILLSRLTTE